MVADKTVTFTFRLVILIFFSSACPTNVVSDVTRGLLPNPFYQADFPNDMECSWNITGPEGSRLILVFNRVCLGICPNAEVQECGCDSLTIANVFKSRQLCLGSELIPFISTGNSVSLTMLTDDQNPSKGYKAEYESVFLDRGKLIIKSLRSAKLS